MGKNHKKNNENNGKLKAKSYEKELRKLQGELCSLQEWVKHKGLRVIIIFEGRDAAGKGGTIRALTERVSPRVFRVVALPAPSDREKSQMYFQRYMQHFPAAGNQRFDPVAAERRTYGGFSHPPVISPQNDEGPAPWGADPSSWSRGESMRSPPENRMGLSAAPAARSSPIRSSSRSSRFPARSLRRAARCGGWRRRSPRGSRLRRWR